MFVLAQLSDVSFSYDNRPVLESADLALGTGEVVGLLGLNGSGKTTTMRLLAGILEPNRGVVQRTYHHLGYLPEERGLYRRLTLEQYLGFVGELNGLSPKACRDRVNTLIGRFLLDPYRGRRIESLSKGNQQKVQLAATLMPSPELMLWDEPFSGLDALNQDLLLDVLKELRAEGVTVLLSTHRLDDLELLADRTYILARRRFQEYVRPRRPALYRLRLSRDRDDVEIEVPAEQLSEVIHARGLEGYTLLSATPKTGLEQVFRELLGEGA
ncbi:MAG: ATP-binding cassette domain-containing protein [Firmicutes bacterium]|nr:ATP-binding cassette domain-containing protein [Bacillota bacterium]